MSGKSIIIHIPFSFFNIGRQGKKPRPITDHAYEPWSRGPATLNPDTLDNQ